MLVGIILVLIGLGVWNAVWAAVDGKEVREAKQAYDQCLAELKTKPTDPDLKQRALALGRAYSKLTRQQNGAAFYDEVALFNDINAACAGATGYGQTSQQPSIEARLARLAELRQHGLLSEEEFQAQRARILTEL